MEYPWFKFYPSMWLSGDVQMLTLEAQGLYMNICALYWKKRGNLTMEQVARRMPDAMRVASELVAEGMLNASGRIQIAWLNELMAESGIQSTTRSAAAKKAAQTRWAEVRRKKDASSNASGNASRTPNAMPQLCQEEEEVEVEGEGEGDGAPPPEDNPDFDPDAYTGLQ